MSIGLTLNPEVCKQKLRLIYPLPLEGERPKGKGLAEGEKSPKPTSAPSGHLLPKEGGKRQSSCIALIYSRRFIILCAAPTLLTPNSSLLTREKSFHPQSMGDSPHGLTLNPLIHSFIEQQAIQKTLSSYFERRDCYGNSFF